MAYITQAELEDYITERELIQLTDDAKAGVVDTEKVDAAIAAACGLIDSYARTRYGTPLPASEMIKALARDIAVWNLEKRRRKIRPDTQTGYDDAVKFLSDLAASKVSLDIPPGTPPPTSDSNVLKTHEPQVFSNKHLKEY